MFPVKELFLEDVLELTKFVIKGDATSCPRDGQRDEKGTDPIFKVLKSKSSFQCTH
jgi:hypothetical protein